MTVPHINLSEIRAQELALQMVIEWLESDNFRHKAKGEVFRDSVSLGKHLKAIGESCDWNPWNITYEHAKRRWLEVLKQAESSGWLIVETTKNGRPRTKDYSATEIANAFRRLQRSSRSFEKERRDECIAGEAEKTNIRVVTLSSKLFEDLLAELTPEAVAGNTRNDLAGALGLQPRASNAFWRWLLHNGWKQKRLRHPDGTRSYVILPEANQ